MEEIFKKFKDSITHLQILHQVFIEKDNFKDNEHDYFLYKENVDKLTSILDKYKFSRQLYNVKGRQMILADVIEYIFLGRGYYFAAKGGEELGGFLKIILYFANLLMCYEAITVVDNLRHNLLKQLGQRMPELSRENYFNELVNFKGKVGLPLKESDAPKELNRYFDTFLPKTAGGLWHELLVYAFLLRYDLGYVTPLVLTQRLLSGSGSIVPPDFLLITKNKHLYGIEVGTKKEVQSGSFSLQTDIPTATIDTINSRSSDRCPICKRWIMFCDPIIENFSNLKYPIERQEVKCLECTKYSPQDILEGKCPYTKYRRLKTKKFYHKFTNGLHYHYRCVLENLDQDQLKIIKKDETALKTHYPYYTGLETLIKT